MKNQLGSSCAWSLSLAVVLMTAVACGDDDDANQNTAGTSGSSVGGKDGGTAGKSDGGMGNGTSGSNSPSGGKGGTTTGGTAGSSMAGAPEQPMGGTSSDAGGGAGGEPAIPAGGAAGSGENPVGGAGGSTQNPDCDYEAAESNSDLPSGLTATSQLKTICANIDNGDYEPVEGLVDRDGFKVDMPGPANILVRVEIPGYAALTDAVLYINGRATPLANGRAAVRRNQGGDQSVTIALRAHSGADIAQVLPYKISFVVDDIDARCPASAAAATFTEAGDGASSRGNDVYQVDDQSVASFTAANDTAEATGITVAAAPAKYRINGTAANIGFAGAYHDSDSYIFHTGPNASQITLRSDWTGTNRDIDLYLFKAGDEIETAVGFEISYDGGEYITAAVTPNTDYVIWNGLYEGTMPSPYSLTLCSEQFSVTGQ
jgi:hypothetical protein